MKFACFFALIYLNNIRIRRWQKEKEEEENPEKATRKFRAGGAS